MTAGKFITFEGGDGAGKTTQIALLEKYLYSKGIKYIRTREPGGTTGAEEIRNLLLTGKANRWDRVTEVLMFFAARRDHVEKKIKPALQNGTWVLCDRFSDSTAAYQGYGHELGADYVWQMHKMALGDFFPDLTILLDIDPNAGVMRSKARLSLESSDENRFENLQRAFHDRIRNGFLEMAKQFDRYAVIDAGHDVDTVHAAIRSAVDKNLL